MHGQAIAVYFLKGGGERGGSFTLGNSTRYWAPSGNLLAEDGRS